MTLMTEFFLLGNTNAHVNDRDFLRALHAEN